MRIWTIIIGDGSGTTRGYKVRANDVWIARQHAIQVFKGHNGLSAYVDHILEGEVKFVPNYEGHEPLVVIDLGTALFGDA